MKRAKNRHAGGDHMTGRGEEGGPGCGFSRMLYLVSEKKSPAKRSIIISRRGPKWALEAVSTRSDGLCSSKLGCKPVVVELKGDGVRRARGYPSPRCRAPGRLARAKCATGPPGRRALPWASS